MKALPLITATILLISCSSESNPTNPGPDTDAILAQGVNLSIIQGNGQIAAVTDTLPDACIVEVRAPGGAQDIGNPIPGVLINFVVTEGGGSVYAGSALTDTLGRAADLWALGVTAGAQRMQARAVRSDGTPVVYETFEATAEPGPPAELDIDVNSIRAFVDQPLVLSDWITCEDQYGNAVIWTGGDVEITTDHEFISIAGDTLMSGSEIETNVHVSAGDLNLSSPLYFFHDLTEYDWTATYALIDSVGIDSIVVSLESTAVEYYNGPDTWPEDDKLAFSMTLSGNYTYFWSNGASTSIDITGIYRTFYQKVGSLGAVWWHNGYNGTSYGGVSCTNLSPLTYKDPGGSAIWLYYGDDAFRDYREWEGWRKAVLVGTPIL